MDFLKKIKNKVIREKIVPLKVPVFQGKLLEEKVALISGGAGGIGIAIAEQFIQNGCKVIITGTNEEKLKNACERLGNNSQYYVLDLLNPTVFDKCIQNISLLFNDNKIDILVNCAGTHGSSSFLDVSLEDWDSIMNINLRGMYFLNQSFGKYLIQNKIQGHILNISSASALKHGKTPYEISKNGVKCMTLGIAEELVKYGIVVNCLAPGPTATSMINLSENASLSWQGNPTGRVATPGEIANWAVFMASDLGNYIIGDSFYVTGGSGTICIDK